MNETPTAVQNTSRLVEVFGYWPSFHDAEVHRAELDRGSGSEPPFITLVVHVFDTDGTVDDKGYYRIRVSVLATLRFSNVQDVALHGFGVQNVLSELRIGPMDGGRSLLTLGECYGFSGSFSFTSADVVEVRPWRAPTEDSPPVRGKPPEAAI